jgi:hypothetical protein
VCNACRNAREELNFGGRNFDIEGYSFVWRREAAVLVPLVIPSEVDESLVVHSKRCLDSARHDKAMSPLVYVLIGLAGGGFVVAVIALVARRGTSGGVQVELVKRLEMIDRGLRDEFSRNREEAGAAAKNQREELSKSLENAVRCRSSPQAITGGQRKSNRQDARDGR